MSYTRYKNPFCKKITYTREKHIKFYLLRSVKYFTVTKVGRKRSYIMQTETYHCDKCARRIKPKWKFIDSAAYIGPTCRKKLIASGVPASEFEQVKKENSK